MKDPYESLGISKSASSSEIKKAFRKLAQKHHPDRGGDPEKFKEISSAYEILSDESKKKQYDTYGRTFDGQQGGFSQGQSTGGFDFSDFNINFGGGFGDIFSDIFGGGRSGGEGRRQSKPRDIGVQIEITLEESFSGVKKSFEIDRTVRCDDCNGTGAEKGNLKKCTDCKGSGQVAEARRTPFGVFQSVKTCPKCSGQGEIPVKTCTKCKGSATESLREKVEIEIPEGIENGEMLRVRGKGNTNKEGTSDLIVQIRVKKHSFFQRDGRDLFAIVKVDYPTLVLGGKISIKTIDGEAKVEIAPGTQDREILKLKGKGMKKSWKRGDFYIEISVEIPKEINKETKNILKELKKKK